MKHTIEEQVGNLLNVLKLHEGQYVLGKTKNGEPGQACSRLNPYMGDGGIQPPGEPLYGPVLYQSEAACQAYVDKLVAKQPGNPEGYCAISMEEWVMQTKLHTEGHPTLREVLKARPELYAAEAESLEKMPEDWVLRLDSSEPVDVALDRKGDGISEDCFLTTAGELVAAGFGQLSFERSASGATVYAKTREEFFKIQESVE